MMCTRKLAKGSNSTCEDSDNYYVCDNDDVQFMYTGDSLLVQRTYTDPWSVLHTCILVIHVY